MPLQRPRCGGAPRAGAPRVPSTRAPAAHTSLSVAGTPTAAPHSVSAQQLGGVNSAWTPARAGRPSRRSRVGNAAARAPAARAAGGAAPPSDLPLHNRFSPLAFFAPAVSADAGTGAVESVLPAATPALPLGARPSGASAARVHGQPASAADAAAATSASSVAVPDLQVTWTSTADAPASARTPAGSPRALVRTSRAPQCVRVTGRAATRTPTQAPTPALPARAVSPTRRSRSTARSPSRSRSPRTRSCTPRRRSRSRRRSTSRTLRQRRSLTRSRSPTPYTTATGSDPRNDRAMRDLHFLPFKARFGLNADMAADVHNAKFPTFFSAANPAESADLSGHIFWANLPFVPELYADIVHNYMRCKQRAPSTTGACFVAPSWIVPHVPDLYDMQLVHTFPAGTRLFTAPGATPGAKRRALGPTHWPVYIFWDPPVVSSTGAAPVTCSAAHSAAAAGDRAAVTSAVHAADDAASSCSGDSACDEVAWPGNPDAEGFTLLGEVRKQRCRIFLDSGATGRLGNFIDRHFAQQLGLQVRPGGPRVEGFDDHSVRSHGTCRAKIAVPNCLDSRETHFRQTLTFTVVDLQRHDVVLGYPFLLLHNPVPDWRAQTLRFDHKGCSFLLRGTYPTAASDDSVHIHTMSARAFARSCAGADVAEVFLCLVRVDDLEQRVGKEMSESDLPPDIPPEVVRLINQHHTVFPAKAAAALPHSHGVEHRIDLMPGAKPPNRFPYRLSPAEQKEALLQINELLPTGCISRSSSPYGAPILFARKKDGGLRMCVDYRALNSITTKNRYPLPRMKDLLDKLGKARVFSSLDLASGFWQIPVHPRDRHKTAFNTPFGKFEWNVMPFGLCNAPATFQAMMDEVMHDFILEGWLVVYMDDVLIYSDTEEGHLAHLARVFQRLAEKKLYCKPHKCAFMKRSIKFLGFIIEDGKISIDPAAKAAVERWTEPKTRTELRSVLGFANIYRDFIPDLSAITAPLSDLQSDKVPFPVPLSTEQRDAFLALQRALTSAPFLRIYDPDAPVLRVRIRTDASDYAVGAVLEQDFGAGFQPIAYESKKLNSAQRNYSAYDRELLAIVHACKHWRYYLHGNQFQCVTDHSTLRHLLSQPEVTNSRRVRWLEQLQEYDMEIVYQPGKSNPADALSRLCLLHATPYGYQVVANGWPVRCAPRARAPGAGARLCAMATAAVTLDPALKQRFLTAYPLDKSCQSFFKGSLLYIGEPSHQRLYVPDDADLKRALMRECHEAPYSAHPGVERTLRLLARRFYWPGMTRDVRAYVRGCVQCHVNKYGARQVGPLQPLPVPRKRWADVSMDFITKLPPAADSGYDAIMVVVDRLSKMAHFIPCRSNLTAHDAADLYLQHVFRLHGMPRSIVSDRDKLFTSNLWQRLFQRLGTRLNMSSGYHPQTDGQTERMNRTLEEMLRAYCGMHDRQSHWERYLPLVEYAYNSTPQTATKRSPFYLCYGEEPLSPVDLVSETATGPTGDSAADEYLQDMFSALVDAQCALLQSQRNMAAYYEKTHSLSGDLKVGDLVYIDHAALPPKRRGSKISPLYHPTPFRVKERIGTNAYRLDTPATFKSHNVFHRSRLRRQPAPRFKQPDRIVDVATRYGQKLVLVRFKDATPEEDLWLPLSTVRAAAATPALPAQ